ncbi:MAG: cyclic nucleotide-binding domain-containing protein [Desulfovibrionaceae bacterium]
MKETPYLEGKQDMLAQLKTIPAFKPFEESKLMEMLALSKLRKYEPGETIMREGAYDCWMYFLLSGTVRVLKDGEEICQLKRYGDVFGEMSVVDGEARSATVIAATIVMCLALDGSIVDRVPPEEKPLFLAVLYRFISEVLAERLRHANEELNKVKLELEQLQQSNR